MAGYSGPEIANSGLILHLDAANYKNFSLTSVEVLVVGGGGGGGGLIYNSSYLVTPGTPYTVTVGAGGTGYNSSSDTAHNGSNSIFGSLTAIGGGGGGGGISTDGSGYAGGSGGGASVRNSSGGSGTSSQGYAGGGGQMPPEYPNYGAGGGGGAGGVGKSGTTTSGGDGGPGLAFDISGTVQYYAAGGGGSVYSNTTSGKGGSGIGGDGAFGSGGNGVANTGSGGGGRDSRGSENKGSGNGGSGIVIVRYQGPQRAIGGTVTTSGKYTIHTFTSVGSTTFTPMTTSTLTGLADLSGNNNFGTPVNGPTYNGANGGSIVFDGVDDYISYQHLSSLDIRREITLEVWFKLTSLSFATSWSNILSKMNTNGDASTRTYSAFINSSGYVHLCSADVIGQEYLNSTSFISSNNWYHWIGVINRSVGSIQHFVNGKLDQSGTIRTTDTISHTEPVCLNIRGGYSRFSGYISSAKIYNRALSAAEVLQSFEATRSRFGI